VEIPPINSRMKSRRIAFWSVFLCCVGLCLLYLYPEITRRSAASRTRELIQPLLIADSRFRRVSVRPATSGHCFLHGTVQSSADLQALHELVERVRPPSTPGFLVTVTNAP
jgi:hypothetical protein